MLFAQLGGRNSFEFVNVPSNARLAALGGVNVSLTDRDVNFFLANPALTGDTLAGFASANYQFYFADIGNASFTYAHNTKRVGMFAFGVQHLGYGAIKSYDATGQEIGDFNAAETALVIGKSHSISNFRLGANIKTAFSNLAGYRSTALMIDLGGVFIHPKQDLRVGLVMKNLGLTLSEYSSTSSTKLPFDVQAGLTYRPEHFIVPIRFSVTAYHLVKNNVTFNDNSTDSQPGIFNKVMRRFNFGSELLIHKNVNLMLGYNYRIRQELKLDEVAGGAGISYGFSARIKSFELTVSRSGFITSSAAYAFSLSTNVNKILMR